MMLPRERNNIFISLDGHCSNRFGEMNRDKLLISATELYSFFFN